MILFSSSTNNRSLRPLRGQCLAHSAGICRSGVSRPWDAQPHIFMARGLAAFSRMFVKFFISALLAPSMQGHRLLVSPASSLSYLVPVCQRAIFQVLPGRLTCLRLCAPGTCLVPCSVSNRTPSRVSASRTGLTLTKTNYLLMYAITSLCLYNILPPRLM